MKKQATSIAPVEDGWLAMSSRTMTDQSSPLVTCHRVKRQSKKVPKYSAPCVLSSRKKRTARTA